MTIRLKENTWRGDPWFINTAFLNWDRTALNRLTRFLAESALPIPRIVKMRIDQYEFTLSNPPERQKGQPLRSWRRQARKWLQDRAGGVRKQRRQLKEQRLKEQRWAILVEQGLPLRDPEAIVWHIKKHMWDTSPKSISQYGYLHVSRLEKIAGGELPPGIDFERVFSTLKGNSGALRAQRAQMRDKLKELLVHPSPKDKFAREARSALKDSVKNAEFRKRHTDGDRVLEVIGYADQGHFTPLEPTMDIRDTSRRHRGRNRNKTDVVVWVRSRWYRTVFKRGLANVLGPETLIIDIDERNGKQIATVGRQPSKHRYAFETVRGELIQKVDGTYALIDEKVVL
jgi:hypothetical protein